MPGLQEAVQEEHELIASQPTGRAGIACIRDSLLHFFRRLVWIDALPLSSTLIVAIGATQTAAIIEA